MELKVGDILYRVSLKTNRQFLWTTYKIIEVVLGNYYKIVKIDLNNNEELSVPILVEKHKIQNYGFLTIALAIKEIKQITLQQIAEHKRDIKTLTDELRELEADLNFLSIKTEQNY